jgi:glycosyltransferase involved in cell wall biosynthesis
VVNLHWITGGLLSIEEIGKIRKPLIWSLYDMWPFCGTEHYGVDHNDARWRTGYTRSNRPSTEHGLDIDRNAWKRKREHWRAAPVVPASTWLAASVQSSALMRDWPITRIPHVIDSDAFTPRDRATARDRLNLDTSAPVILFLSSAGTKDQRKGFDLLETALPAVRRAIPEVHVLVVGPKDDNRSHVAGVPVIWFGGAENDRVLAELYSAANVTAVPSREDNMPLTAMEAQTCGRAVVGFRIGGMPDIVVHHETGFLAEPGDTSGLAVGLIEALEDSQHASNWGVAARARAESTWSVPIVVRQYQAVYERAMA